MQNQEFTTSTTSTSCNGCKGRANGCLSSAIFFASLYEALENLTEFTPISNILALNSEIAALIATK